jgi:PhnB protein
MPTKLNPYLNFRDNAREAMEFYHSVFGGDLKMQTFKEFHASQDPSEDDLIMHSELELDSDMCMTLMAADTPKRMEYKPGNNVSMSLSGDNNTMDRLTTIFDKLAKGGNITMPMEKAVWGDTFGMCIDRFGINWLVNIAAPKM